MSLFNAKLPSLKDRHRAMLEPVGIPLKKGADDSEGADNIEPEALPAKRKVGRKLKAK